MGIKNLLKFLNNFPELIVDQNVNDLSGKKIAIDISILLYQVVISVRNSGADLTNKKGEFFINILDKNSNSSFFVDYFDNYLNNLKNKSLNYYTNNILDH